MRTFALLAFLLLAPACGGLTAGEITSSTDSATAGTKESDATAKRTRNVKAADDDGDDDDAQCDGYAVCDDGNSYFSEKECVSASPGSVCKRHPKEICGTKIWCPENEVRVCTAAPMCNGNEDSFKSEEDCKGSTARVGCRAVSMCNHTIWCGEHADQCAAVPSCKTGETEFKAEADCKKHDTDGCRSVTLCGATIWCGVPGDKP